MVGSGIHAVFVFCLASRPLPSNPPSFRQARSPSRRQHRSPSVAANVRASYVSRPKWVYTYTAVRSPSSASAAARPPSAALTTLTVARPMAASCSVRGGEVEAMVGVGRGPRGHNDHARRARVVFFFLFSCVCADTLHGEKNTELPKRVAFFRAASSSPSSACWAQRGLGAHPLRPPCPSCCCV